MITQDQKDYLIILLRENKESISGINDLTKTEAIEKIKALTKQ